MAEVYDVDLGVGLKDKTLESLNSVNMALLEMTKMVDLSNQSCLNMTMVVQDGNTVLAALTKEMLEFSAALQKVAPAASALQGASATASAPTASDNIYSALPTTNLNFPKTIGDMIAGGLNAAMQESMVVGNMQAAGISAQDIQGAEATAQAEQVSLPGTTVNGNLNALYNFSTALKSFSNATSDSSSLLKAAIRANSQNGENEADIDETAYGMAELDSASINFIDPAIHKINWQVAEALNNGVANIILATKGSVTADGFYKDVNKDNNYAVSQIKDAASFAAMEPFILALGGDGVKDTLSALGSVFGKSNMSQGEAGALEGLGISPASLAQAKTPAQWASWFETILIPALDKNGYTTAQAQQRFLGSMLSGVQGAQALNPLLKNLEIFDSSYNDYQKAANNQKNGYDYVSQNNVALKWNAFGAALQSFLQALGNAALPQITTTLNQTANELNVFSAYAKNHPDADRAGMGILSILFGGKWLGKILGKDGAGCGCTPNPCNLPDPCESQSAKIMNAVKKSFTKIEVALGLSDAAGVLSGGHGPIKSPPVSGRFPFLSKPLQPPMHIDFENKFRKDYQLYKDDLEDSPDKFEAIAAEMAAILAGMWAFLSTLEPLLAERDDLHGTMSGSMAHQAGVQTGPSGFDYTHGLIHPAGVYL